MEQIGQVHAWQQVAEIDLIYKSKVKAADRPKIASSTEAYEVFMKLWNRDKIDLVEEFKVLFLNRGNRVLGVFHVSTGGVTGTVADPKVIFAAALKANACSVIMAHNHPSGSLQPSKADEELTQKISGGGKLLDIKVLDHLIIHVDGYYSFADEGFI